MELFFYLKCEESKITEIFLLDFKKTNGHITCQINQKYY